MVDYWARGNDVWRLIGKFLEHLGFDVAYDTGETQADMACGYVAARCSVDLRLAGDGWAQCSLSHAASPAWVESGNCVLASDAVLPVDRLPYQKGGRMLREAQIQAITRAFWVEGSRSAGARMHAACTRGSRTRVHVRVRAPWADNSALLLPSSLFCCIRSPTHVFSPQTDLNARI